MDIHVTQSPTDKACFDFKYLSKRSYPELEGAHKSQGKVRDKVLKADATINLDNLST